MLVDICVCASVRPGLSSAEAALGAVAHIRSLCSDYRGCYEADAGRLILAWLSFVQVLTSGDLQCSKHR